MWACLVGIISSFHVSFPCLHLAVVMGYSGRPIVQRGRAYRFRCPCLQMPCITPPTPGGNRPMFSLQGKPGWTSPRFSLWWVDDPNQPIRILPRDYHSEERERKRKRKRCHSYRQPELPFFTMWWWQKQTWTHLAVFFPFIPEKMSQEFLYS